MTPPVDSMSLQAATAQLSLKDKHLFESIMQTMKMLKIKRKPFAQI